MSAKAGESGSTQPLHSGLAVILIRRDGVDGMAMLGHVALTSALGRAERICSTWTGGNVGCSRFVAGEDNFAVSGKWPPLRRNQEGLGLPPATPGILEQPHAEGDGGIGRD